MAKRTLPYGGTVPMDPGERDRRVVIEALTETVGTSGRPVEGWTSLCTTWAKRDDLKGSERFAAAQISAPFNVRWELPYASSYDPELMDVTKTRRLVYQGRVHDVVAASVIGRREGVELLTLAAGRVDA